MPEFEVLFTAAIDAARAAVAAIPDELARIKALSDPKLLSAQRGLSELRRLIDSRSSTIAGEVAFRSRRELGYAGLARREGFGTAEKLIQNETGSTAREATTLVVVGTMVHEALISTVANAGSGELPEGCEVREPWLSVIGAAVASGELTMEKARAIKAGLGEPSVESGDSGVSSEEPGVSSEDLAELASRLLGEAGPLNADRLFSLAREYRDELDVAGIALRERAIYEQRSFRRSRRPNGLSRYTIDPDIETAAYIDNLFDNLLSPRRGGPRFVDPEDKAWAETIANDERTNDQYLHDAFAGLLRLGVDADVADRASARVTSLAGGNTRASGRTRITAAHRARIVGSRVPAVRVLTTARTLATHRGSGRVEGSELPVSVESVERAICVAGTVSLVISPDGEVLELGREARLFSGHQKVALAARDGGCLWTDCDRPPAWTEAHHIDQWARDRGRTDVRDGVLLCRYHHMLLHNNHWEIVRRDSEYWLIPPDDIDSTRRPRRLRSKSAVLRDLQRERGATTG